MREKSAYIGLDLFTGEESVTADQVFESEGGAVGTGLVDQYGEPIMRRPTRTKIGFDLG